MRGVDVEEPAVIALAPANVGVPAPVPGVTAVRGDRSVNLSWRQPVGNGGSAITGYLVQSRGLVNGAWSAWQTVPRPSSPALAMVVDGLLNGRQYLFRVAAVNAVGRGDFAQLAAPVTPLGTPQAPAALTAAATTGRVSLRWGVPVDTGGAPVANYQVQIRRDVGGTWSDWAAVPRAASSTRVATAAGLPNGVLHAFRVRAVTAAGAGAWTPGDCFALPTYFVAGIAPPSGWVHRDGPYSSYFMPNSSWRAVDSQAGLSISSPTGVIGVDLAIVPQYPVPSTPRQVVERILGQAPGLSYQITRVGSLVASGVSQRQEFEWTGVARNPNGNFNVRGVIQAVVVNDVWNRAYGYYASNMAARTDLWAGALSTMQAIRANMRRMR